MSEEIYIQFTPTDFKYHYDCIRIHTESENLLIPIHAFPLMTKKRPIFPNRIDMGIKGIGETAMKVFNLPVN
jgi:hypothetical protein